METQVKKNAFKLKHKFYKFSTGDGKPYRYTNEDKIKLVVDGQKTDIKIADVFVETFLGITPSFESTKMDGYSILQYLNPKTGTLQIEYNGEIKNVSIKLLDEGNNTTFYLSAIEDLVIPLGTKTINQKQLDDYINLLFSNKKKNPVTVTEGSEVKPVELKQEKENVKEKELEAENVKLQKEKEENEKELEEKEREEKEEQEKINKAKLEEEEKENDRLKEIEDNKEAFEGYANDLINDGFEKYKIGNYYFFHNTQTEQFLRVYENSWEFEHLDYDIDDDSVQEEKMIYTLKDGEEKKKLVFDVKEKVATIENV